jgi:pyruvate kinase
MRSESASSSLVKSGRRAPATLAKIIATVGPASSSADVLRRLMVAGVHVFRVNFSHGELDQHAERVRTIRAVARELGQPAAILGDLQGPKVRVGELPEPLVVFEGQAVALRTDPSDAVDTSEPTVIVPSGFARLASDVHAGHRVLINDGAVRLVAVTRKAGDGPGTLRCRCELGGAIASRKGINVPDTRLLCSPITERDWRCVEWAVGIGLDYLALSFVRSAEEVMELKRALEGMCSADHTIAHHDAARIPVIAKIETPQAVEAIASIVQAADGIMVARGDLGVEMDLAVVPVVQRRLIAAADRWGKPAIVATQMLETMITASVPTRAEVSDVSTAIREGADAVMLSAETATGHDPVLVVDTMRRIMIEAEEELRAQHNEPSPPRALQETHHRTAALAHGAFHVARDVGAVVIACWSQEGGGARFLSQTGCRVPIVAYTDDPRQVGRMALLRAVTPRLMDLPADGSLGWFNLAAERDLLGMGWVKPGDMIVLMAGRPLGVKRSTTALAVHEVGSPLTGFMQD